MTDKIDWFHSKEMVKEMRKEGRVLTASGGYSTKKEIQDFRAGLVKRLKKETAELKKAIKEADRDLGKF